MKFELFNATKKTTPVVFVLRRNKNGHRIYLKYYCGFSIKPDQWNPNNQRVRELYGIPHSDYNDIIDKIEKTVKKMFKENDYITLTADKIRLAIDVALKRKTGTGEKFPGYLDKFIEDFTERKGYNTVKSFTTLKNKLPSGLNWNDFDYSFYLKFTAKLEAKGHSANYIGKMVNNLKIVLNHAYLEGKHTNLEFKKFRVLREDVYNIYLSEDELIKMYELELSGYLEKARDLFMLGAWTGMRVDNYLNIDPDMNIDLKNNIITVVVNKNGPRVKIPIHWIIREIIEKYNGLPKSISQQKLNKYIKEVGRKAGITENIIQVKTIGGKRREIITEKCELISSHTARRSLATNLYLRDAPLKYIMSITGHKTEAQCLHYIKSGVDEIIEKVSKLDFWKK